MEAHYEPLPEQAVVIVCPRCGQGAFIHHENRPGQATILMCSVCDEKVIVNIVSFISATRVYEPDVFKEVG